MLKLWMIFPYGLNDWLGDGFMKEGTYGLVGPKFPALTIKPEFLWAGFKLGVFWNAIYFSIIAMPKKSHFTIFVLQDRKKCMNSIDVVRIIFVR